MPGNTCSEGLVDPFPKIQSASLVRLNRLQESQKAFLAYVVGQGIQISLEGIWAKNAEVADPGASFVGNNIPVQKPFYQTEYIFIPEMQQVAVAIKAKPFELPGFTQPSDCMILLKDRTVQGFLLKMPSCAQPG
jgi:hypothetical protein